MSPSTTSATLNTEKSTEHSAVASSSPARLRVWPAVVLVALFWLFLYANHHFELSGGLRFVSRLLSYAVVLLAFLVWWLTRSSIRWRDRLAAVAVMLAAGALACIAADGVMRAPFFMFLASLPIVLTVWTAWLLIARSTSPATLRLGFCVAMLLAFGYFTLVRFDGLDASQQAETSWRWQATKEQAFLSQEKPTVSGGGHAVLPPKAAPHAADNPWTPQPSDILEFRGPRRDGIITGTHISTDWSATPPKQLWRRKVGPAWSGVIVVDGHLVTQEQRGNFEVVSCYSAATGDEEWTHQDETRFEEALAGAGPRATPTFASGRIYAFGAKGTLNCLDAKSGAVIWTHDCMADAEVTTAEMPTWGYSVSPLIVDGRVIVFTGGTKDKNALAFNAADGKLAWSSPGGKQSYSSPQLAALQGQRQVLMHDTHSLMGLNISDGTLLWSAPNPTELAMPMLQPHIGPDDSVIYNMEPGVTRLKITREGEKWKAELGWTSNSLRAGFSDFVLQGDLLFGLNDGVLCCIDLANGERLWKKGRLGHGQVLLLADQNLLLVSSDKGEVILVSADRAGYKELGRFQAIEGKTWNGPVVTDDRLFIRNGEEMAAYALPAKDAPAAAK